MRIFDRPDLDQRRGRLALFVTGAFATAKPNIAYEGRLQIHNQIGAATVEQIDGGELPPGHALYVDGDEVVVSWPAYQETGVIPFASGNGNFELGDTGWSKGAGWAIEASGGPNDGFGAYVGVFRAQGASMLEAEAFSPTFPGQTFSAQVNVQQGASSKYNVGAGITMRFYDSAKNLIEDQLGPFINDGSNGAWHMSQAAFAAPGGARYVRGAVRGHRFRENKPLWVDDASWTLQATVGINYQTTIPLTLRVRDTAGRSYVWTGSIIVYPYAPVWASTPLASNALATVFKSLTGLDWSPSTYVMTNSANEIAGLVFAGGGRLFVLNDASTRRVSVDNGATFIDVVGIPANQPRAMCYTGVAWIVVPYGGFAGAYGCRRSTDGINFTEVSMGSANFLGDCIARGAIVLVGRRGSGIGRSTNHGEAGSWTSFALPAASEGEYFADSGTTFAVCGGGILTNVYLSASGASGTWVASPLPGSVTPRGLAYGNGRFMLIDRDGVTYVRPDSTGVWVQVGTAGPIDNTATPYTSMLIFAQGHFIAAGSGGRVYTSDDGVVWASTMLTSSKVTSLAWQP